MERVRDWRERVAGRRRNSRRGRLRGTEADVLGESASAQAGGGRMVRVVAAPVARAERRSWSRGRPAPDRGRTRQRARTDPRRPPGARPWRPGRARGWTGSSTGCLPAWVGVCLRRLERMSSSARRGSYERCRAALQRFRLSLPSSLPTSLLGLNVVDVESGSGPLLPRNM